MANFKQLIYYLNDSCLSTKTLSFDEISRLTGVRVDQTFFDNRRIFEREGFSIMKVDVGKRTVTFARNA